MSHATRSTELTEEQATAAIDKMGSRVFGFTADTGRLALAEDVLRWAHTEWRVAALTAERNRLLASVGGWEAKLTTLKAQNDALLALVRVFADASPRNAQARWDARDKARALLASLDGSAR